jgi:hypothetical protein
MKKGRIMLMEETVQQFRGVKQMGKGVLFI